MALAQGSGELIWWPYIVTKLGLASRHLLFGLPGIGGSLHLYKSHGIAARHVRAK